LAGKTEETTHYTGLRIIILSIVLGIKNFRLDFMQTPFDIPILLIVFNRPGTTSKVFSVIRETKPGRLYIAADGPRPGIQSDLAACASVREIVSNIDWPCENKFLFHENNLGCRDSMITAITWLFTHEEMGIILEDDCLPIHSFFLYCKELLDRYKDNENIMHIGGNNFQNGKTRGEASYYFSAFSHIWGWATWRRAWNLYDKQVDGLQDLLQKKCLDRIFKSAIDRQYWTMIFELIRRGEISIWDYQWQFSIWHNGGLCISPNNNLVTNIGFGDAATHTKNIYSWLANLYSTNISIPLIHPIIIQRDLAADDYTQRKIFRPKPLILRIIKKLFTIFRKRI